MDQSINKAKIWDMEWPYTPSVSTDVLKTWIRHGYVPPSATFKSRDQWFAMKHRLCFNEEKTR